jgi:hypothetical protein
VLTRTSSNLVCWLVEDKPILSWERILYKDSHRKSSVEKRNLRSRISRGLAPKRTERR